MKFGLRVPPCASPQEVAATIVRAEADGFDYAWVPDSQLLWRDVWVTMGTVGAQTSRIVLGTNVTNPVTRHVTVTASAAAAMDELTGGRFVLGIGSGDSSVRVMGWKPAKMAAMRDYIDLLRPLWRGEDVAPYGSRFHLKGATGRHVPVYVSATGPKMLQFAGAVADYDSSIARDAANAWVFYRRGLALMSLLRDDEAYRDFTRALQLDPAFADAFCGRADVWRRRGDAAGVRRNLEAALSAAPRKWEKRRGVKAELRAISSAYPR